MLWGKQIRIRLDTFNLLKGFLMILIIAGHKLGSFTFDESSALWGIRSGIHVLESAINPAFFMIAGFGYRVLSTKKALSKTANELLKPYLYVMVAFTVCFPLIHYATYGWWAGAIRETMRFVLAFLLGIPRAGRLIFGFHVYDCSAMWFILALFISTNVLNAILQQKDVRLQSVLVSCSVVAGYLLSKVGFDYFCLQQGLVAVGFCYVGYMIKKYKVYQSKWLPLILIVLARIAYYEYDKAGFGMAFGIYVKGLWEVVLAACSGALLLFLGIIAGNTAWRILSPIKTVGVYTYWILCIHSIELCCIPWYKWGEYMQNRQLLGYAIELIATGLICWMGCMLLKQITKYRYKRRCVANGK